MIQSPGGGSACHGVSLFIYREYGLRKDCQVQKNEKEALTPVVTGVVLPFGVVGVEVTTGREKNVHRKSHREDFLLLKHLFFAATQGHSSGVLREFACV